MIKTYLVPVSDEVIKAMEKGEAPSFLHCATCLEGLTNGEVFHKVFPDVDVDGDIMFWHGVDWWIAKWGE